MGMTDAVFRVIMNDPGRHNDPWGVVGMDLTQDGKMMVKLARQFSKTEYGKIAQYLAGLSKRVGPDIIGIETNNRGKYVQRLYREKYNLGLTGVFTSSNLREETRNAGNTMDKEFMVKWVKTQLESGNIILPKNQNNGIEKLVWQISQIVRNQTPSGRYSYKAQKSRHDDLYMAFLLCCHQVFLHMRRIGA